MAHRSSKLRQLAAAAGVLGVLCLGSLTARAVGQEAPKLPRYEVTGFRDVRFGMSEADVRAAATKTFGLKPSDMTLATNPIEGTAVLTVKVASLDPAPGPARIAYIFGHTSKKLIPVSYTHLTLPTNREV